MRPKKRILLIDPDDDRRGELKFILEVWGFSVIQHARGQIDLILVRWPIAAGSCRKLKEANPLTPLVILHSAVDVLNGRSPMIQSADAVWSEASSRAVLWENVRIITARKRGPRKGSRRKPPATETINPAQASATA